MQFTGILAMMAVKSSGRKVHAVRGFLDMRLVQVQMAAWSWVVPGPGEMVVSARWRSLQALSYFLAWRVASSLFLPLSLISFLRSNGYDFYQFIGPYVFDNLSHIKLLERFDHIGLSSLKNIKVRIVF